MKRSKKKVEAEASSAPWKAYFFKIHDEKENIQENLWKGPGKEDNNLDALVEQIDPTFTDEIMEEEVSPKFKIPTIKPYNRKKDPKEHLDLIDLGSNYTRFRCRAFFFTLTGTTKEWYRKLKRRSISLFKELARAFVTQFLGGKDQRKLTTYFLTIKRDLRKPGNST